MGARLGGGCDTRSHRRSYPSGGASGGDPATARRGQRRRSHVAGASPHPRRNPRSRIRAGHVVGTRRATVKLAAWHRGDFATIEEMLEPDVEWRSFEPGEWDCNNRNDVMQTLRDRHKQGFARGELEFLEAGVVP